MNRLKNRNRWTREHTLWLVVIVVLAIGAATLTGCGAAVDAAKNVAGQIPSREGSGVYADYASLAEDIGGGPLTSETEFESVTGFLCDNDSTEMTELLQMLMGITSGSGEFSGMVKEKAAHIYVSCPEKGAVLTDAMTTVSGGVVQTDVMNLVRLADKAAAVRG